MSTPLLAGLGIAVAAYGSKYALEALQRYRARPPVARIRKYYEGGFQPVMTRREAALILGVRESAALEKIKDAHRKVMIANHPDSGGSDFLASKINEAKDHLMGQTKGSGSPF
ncbi:chaperone DnaJ-domain superfamily protein [Klebsormidium nitens]|uniref:Chaperone DnaJ-domain superfamily protein n=1 Tax=Klebsormidium nitens TaxID=105231 RepID=A0A1Y1I3U8_KLENI|nr:chaperone DnaJ-domain superfamily protein [Klebsormidium nitens]|eukprot:GAQ83417.1 chaperone DnaJ-domain superfamily protein [Klebsormidium nitens]